jgi:FkbM family methyltransferase
VRASSGRSLAWRAWALVPAPLKGPAHAGISLARRLRARATPLPEGERPPLPASAVELRTRYGSMWFDADDEKLTPWVRREATWEADVLRLLDGHLRPGMTAVDVGANVGFHTVVLSQLVGEAGHVHAFEPLPVTLELLRANLWRHHCDNTVVHPQAVSSEGGRVHIAPDPEGRSGARLADSGVEVDAVTLDATLGGAPVDLLKVDVEGAEPLVFAGARATIAASPNLLAIVEFRNEGHLDGSAPEQVLALYESLGFRLQLLRADGTTRDASHDDVLAAATANETINLVLRRS